MDRRTRLGSAYAGKPGEPNTMRRLLTNFAVHLASPWAFVVFGFYAVSWFVFSREHFGWHDVAVVATLFMTLFIQRAAHRDTQAIHAKLDELLQVNHLASNALTRLDEAEPEDIERHRKEARVDRSKH